MVTSSTTASYGLFSFATIKWPPESFSDLIIDQIYPINIDFKLDTITQSGNMLFEYQFKILTKTTHSIYYYYPINSPTCKNFITFKDDVRLAEKGNLIICIYREKLTHKQLIKFQNR